MRKFAVRNLVALLALFALAAAAQAKLVAVADPQPLATISPDDVAISTGPAGVMLERDYFSAPQATYNAGRSFPCRMQRGMFDKSRLAQACD